MKWNIGARVGAASVVLMLGGCSNESEGASAVAAGGASVKAVSNAQGKKGPSAPTVVCLAEGFTYTANAIESAMAKPREAIAANIPAEEVVYWRGDAPGQKHTPARAVYCGSNMSREQIDRYSDHNEAFDAIRAQTSINRSAVDEELLANPFGTLSALMKYRQASAKKFEASPKGDFEKTTDYNARIAREKAAFDTANSGKKVAAQDIAYAWVGLFGNPRFKDDDFYPGTKLYNPDTETLSLTIVPASISVVRVRSQGAGKPPVRERVPQYPFEIPIKIKLKPEQAEKLFAEYDPYKLLQLSPVVAMQIHNGSLIVREVSIKDYESASYLVEDNFSRMGFKLDHIPVNFELSKSLFPQQ